MSNVDTAKMGTPASASADEIPASTPTNPNSSGPSTLKQAQPGSDRSLSISTEAGSTSDSSSSVRVIAKKGLSKLMGVLPRLVPSGGW